MSRADFIYIYIVMKEEGWAEGKEREKEGTEKGSGGEKVSAGSAGSVGRLSQSW